MSITDELRKALGRIRIMAEEQDDCSTLYYISPTVDELTAIADRIDREHRMALEKVAAEVDTLPMTDESMAENGLVRLPVDADGVPIRVGDRLTDGEYTFTAYELAVYGDGSWSIRNEDGIAWAACDVTHCASTVEGVLREFFSRYVTTKPKDEDDAILAEYAAKLRLAGEDA